MDFVIESLSADWENFLRFAPRFIYASILFALFLIAASFAGRHTALLLQRSFKLKANTQFLRHIVSWAIGSVGALLALGILGFHGIATSLLATGGVVAIVLGFAFREIGENFLAGLFLTFSRPFEIDDLIRTGDLTGKVRSIELRYVHIRTFDACDVFVPSAQIFREPLYNYTRDGLRRPSFTVGVVYKDEPEKVLDILRNAAAGVPNVLDEPRAFVTVKEFGAHFIVYEVFFWLDVDKNERGYIDVQNDVKISCWRALGDAGFSFSTDADSGLSIHSIPPLEVSLKTNDE